MAKRFRNLTEPQHWTLMSIAFHGGAHAADQRTLAALEKKGYITQLPREPIGRVWEVTPGTAEELSAWRRDQARNRHHLPEPECEHGYTRRQIEQIIGERRSDFGRWMDGQTVTLCEGRSYNHETKEYEAACGGIAHGPVVYEHDLVRFLDGRPIVD